MDDLISRQEVLEATSTTLKITGKENAETVYEYIKKLCDDIKALPSAQTADAVEVVRCYKCIHWDEDTVRRNSNDATWWNEAVCRKYSDDIWEVWKDADWFCADGERKTDEE